ncbi:MAG: FABP family protein, partial [Deltaproteobacteria bacterium]|nr:FABP family protein [Deltaproteobacteria bacterium]
MNDEERKNLGPLAALVGVWEGDRGMDVAPGADREPADTPFSERMSFELLGPVDNHEQVLWGLRYRTEVTRLSDGMGFHEDMGYWLWDAEREQVMRAFVVPRGVSVLAGGDAKADSRSFSIEAVRGAPVYGVSANAFL